MALTHRDFLFGAFCLDYKRENLTSILKVMMFKKSVKLPNSVLSHLTLTLSPIGYVDTLESFSWKIIPKFQLPEF